MKVLVSAVLAVALSLTLTQQSFGFGLLSGLFGGLFQPRVTVVQTPVFAQQPIVVQQAPVFVQRAPVYSQPIARAPVYVQRQVYSQRAFAPGCNAGASNFRALGY